MALRRGNVAQSGAFPLLLFKHWYDAQSGAPLPPLPVINVSYVRLWAQGRACSSLMSERHNDAQSAPPAPIRAHS